MKHKVLHTHVSVVHKLWGGATDDEKVASQHHEEPGIDKVEEETLQPYSIVAFEESFGSLGWQTNRWMWHKRGVKQLSQSLTHLPQSNTSEQWDSTEPYGDNRGVKGEKVNYQVDCSAHCWCSLRLIVLSHDIGEGTNYFERRWRQGGHHLTRLTAIVEEDLTIIFEDNSNVNWVDFIPA